MTPRPQLYFWQNIPAMHQVPYQRELPELGADVHLIVDALMPESRRLMGWNLPDMGKIHLHSALTQPQVQSLIDAQPPDAINFATNPRGTIHAKFINNYCAQKHRRLFWINEAPIKMGLSGHLRALLYWVEGRFIYKNKVEGILAMGELGARKFRRYGYKKILPFMYSVTPPPIAGNSPAGISPDTVNFTFIGEFIPRKGLDFLLPAIARLPGANWRLHMVGIGPEEQNLKTLAQNLNISGNITWHGPVPNTAIGDYLAATDVLVLPSRFDGWGAVVQEALLTGTRAIASDQCGSESLIRATNGGSVVKARNIPALAAALAQNNRKQSPEARAQLRARTLQLASPKVIAQSLLTFVLPQK